MTPDGPPAGTSADRHDDDDLRQRFATERAHDERSIPSLARVLRPRRAPTGARRLPARLALGAVAVLVIAVGVWRRSGSTEPEFVLVPGQLRVPTDFLLDMSGSLSVRAAEVPSIGSIDWYPLHQQEIMR